MRACPERGSAAVKCIMSWIEGVCYGEAGGPSGTGGQVPGSVRGCEVFKAVRTGFCGCGGGAHRVGSARAWMVMPANMALSGDNEEKVPGARRGPAASVPGRPVHPGGQSTWAASAPGRPEHLGSQCTWAARAPGQPVHLGGTDGRVHWLLIAFQHANACSPRLVLVPGGRC
eukprot:355668-Chlamydomonas_euryale.AAC.13